MILKPEVISVYMYIDYMYIYIIYCQICVLNSFEHQITEKYFSNGYLLIECCTYIYTYIYLRTTRFFITSLRLYSNSHYKHSLNSAGSSAVIVRNNFIKFTKIPVPRKVFCGTKMLNFKMLSRA